MKLSKLAWHNLWRRKRRTLITGFSIGFGVMLAVTFTGTGDYSYTKMIDSSARMGFGHVTVEPQGYNQTPALDKRIQQTTQLREQLLSLPGVDDAIVRIVGQAMFASASKTIGGMFMAIDPAQESAEYNLMLDSITEGELLLAAGKRSVVVGSGVAKKLNLRIGKKLIYTTTDINGEIISEISRVTGIFQTGVTEVDSAMVLLPINNVRKTLSYGPDDATLVSVLIRDQRDSIQMREKIEALVGNSEREVLSWHQTQSEIASVINMDRSGNYISQVLVGVLIAAGILNTMLMSVLERNREFGIMMAVGMSPFTLFRLVMIESFWLALIGLTMGVVITTPWYLYLFNVGIDLSGAVGDDYSAGGVLIDPIFKIRLFKESVIAILTGVFSLAMISGLYPAWRAVRILPVESLKTL